jgi:hypothetical protein
MKRASKAALSTVGAAMASGLMVAGTASPASPAPPVGSENGGTKRGTGKKYLVEVEPQIATVVAMMALDAGCSPTRLLEELIEDEVRDRLAAGYGPTFTEDYEKAREAILHKE